MDLQNFLIFYIFFLSLFLDFTHSAAPLPGLGFGSSSGFSYPRLDPTKVTQVSQHPRAFIYKEFLTDEECDHLISMLYGLDFRTCEELAPSNHAKISRNKFDIMIINSGDQATHLEKATVGDDSGMEVESHVRTSYGMFLDKAQDKVVAAVEARIAAWTFHPEENGEEMQILRYQIGQKYEPHYDSSEDQSTQMYGGRRSATVLMYLSNVEEGGETVFPEAYNVTQVKDDTWSECAKTGYAVKPKKGDALLFFSIHPNTTLDYSSVHRACPVIKGEKWSATKWIHVRSYEQVEEEVEQPLKSDCADDNKDCAYLASIGECENNREYMVGSESILGYCRKSCKAC